MRGAYRAGQAVKVRAGGFAGLGLLGIGADRLVDCVVVCAAQHGAYAVASLSSGLAAIVDADDIVTRPERRPRVEAPSLKVVFFGNGTFALPILRRLVQEGFDVRAVVSNPDAKRGRGGLSAATPVAQYAAERGITLLTPLSASDPSFAAALSKLSPDIGVIAEYGILPKAVHRMPRLGTINLHSSLLPEYRGASTVSSAIRDGRPYTGITAFLLSDGVDCGDIAGNMLVPICDGDDSEAVLEKMRALAPSLASEAVRTVAAGLALAPQDALAPYLAKTPYASKVFRRDLMADWRLPASKARDFIRAYSPSPSAWTDMSQNGGQSFRGVKLHRASLTSIPAAGSAPGSWRADKGRLLVACADLMLSVEELQLPGGRRVSAADFCNGLRGLRRGSCALPCGA